MSSLLWHAVPPGMREVYNQISEALREGEYYVAGGTALALVEGHRVSVDLDVFCPTMPDVEDLLESLAANVGELSIRSIGRRTLYLEVQNTQVSVIEYRYPLLRPTMVPAHGGLALASLDDIATMKLSAIANRGSRKDFVDLWILQRRHRSLSEYLELFREKFSIRDIGHVVRSLVYFENANSEPPLRLLIDIDWDTVKQDFKDQVSGWLARGRE